MKFRMCLILIPVAQASQLATDQIDHDCIGCICEAMLCNTSMTCNAKLCGPYRIMHEYWIDAGKPMLQGDNVNDQNGKPITDQSHNYIDLNVTTRSCIGRMSNKMYPRDRKSSKWSLIAS